jgi:sterol-4alpha-carboxylate 3-dehydrogenase (decarboxylating)
MLLFQYLILLSSPGDRQFMSGLYKVYENGQTHFQIGENTNLFDFTYVANVARAHLLAADKLVPPSSPQTVVENDKLPDHEAYPLTQAEEDIIGYPIRPIDLTTGSHRIPTCESRPLGPYLTLPPNAEIISTAFSSPTPPPSTLPVLRSRFDALTEDSIAHTKAANNGVSPLQVAGQAFFITNGEPCYFWDMPRAVWHELDAIYPEARKSKRRQITLPKTLGLAAATGAEWYSWLVGKDPTFTRFKVSFSCATRWYNIEKARRVLGYEPEVALDEGIKRMVDVSSSLWNLVII